MRYRVARIFVAGLVPAATAFPTAASPIGKAWIKRSFTGSTGSFVG
jgi:hypothetical protein